MGLHVLREPEEIAFDIIFVHGLGGHSQRTWSKNHDPGFFWPELWLPFEPGVEKARISTFGYDANWRGASRSISNITDFAKELLFEMRFARTLAGEELDIGSRPVVFVAHSMGGLVVKKTYLLGLHDEIYSEMVSSIRGIIFLSTPHRGSNLAEVLNRVLSVSFQSPKSFITDLTKSSPAIEELNEQFRHHAPRLSTWSFYETLATSMGLKNVMVLEKETSILGYPAEISRPLQADHHGVCKFSSPVDSNYLSVRNAIIFLASTLSSRETRSKAEGTDTADSEHTVLQCLSRALPTVEDDYRSILDNWVPDTCTWILQNPCIIHWLDSTPKSRIVWYVAPPGSGKTTIAAFLVNHLRRAGVPCQFFFFKYSDQSRRSVATCFRVLAHQLAKSVPAFREELGRISPETSGLESSSDPLLTWRTLFEQALLKASSSEVFWVIDALDECESPRMFLDCLKSISDANAPFRILLLSRNTDVISAGVDRLSSGILVEQIESPNPDYAQEDIRRFLTQELRHMRGTTEFKDRLLEKLLARCEGNFLWAKLVLDEILHCHTEEGIEDVLREVPDDMTDLYRRMEENLTSSVRKANKPLILALFQWTICAQRPLDLKEMSQALQPQFSHFVDLRWTIKETCGQFLQVQESGEIDMLHHTAREYLTNNRDGDFHVEPRKTHGILFQTTIRVLTDPNLRWRLVQSQDLLQDSEPFVYYSAINWSYHLGHSNQASDSYLDLLIDFFRGQAILTWIHVLAVSKKLEVLVKTSRVLTAFVRTVKRLNATRNPMQHRLTDIQLLEDWSVDLIKVVGKFGSHIISIPGVVYDVVPALCPGESVLRRTCYSPHTGSLRIQGTEMEDWSDNLARLTLDGASKCYKISCAGKYLAVLALGIPGATYIWDTTNFARVCVVEHGEAVVAIVLNARGDTLATYGLKTTKMWSIPSATLLRSTPNPRYVKAKALVFADGDRKLLFGGDDNVVRSISVEDFNGWQIPLPHLLKETVRIEGAIINSPMCIAFNGGNNLVGVSYRGAPLSVWSLLDGRCMNRCYRSKSFQDDRRQSSNASSSSTTWWGVDRFTWNPVTDHVLGVYRDGCVFKWHPLTNENVEAPNARADEIAASPDGKLFATSSNNGAVRIWNFAYFTIIYQLSSDDIVAELAFSTDSRRFYDLRGGSVNAWESNSLARFFDQEEQATSDTNSEDRSTTELSKFSEARLVPFEAISAFAPTADGSLYAVSYKNGAVHLFEKGQANGVEIAQFRSFFDVQHIRWSKDGQYVTVGDVSGRIDVMSVQRGVEDARGLKISNLPSPSILLKDQTVHGILFSEDCLHMIIVASNTIFVCFVATGSLAASKDFDNCMSRAWVLSSSQPDLLLGFGQKDIHAYRWQDLEFQWSQPYQRQKKAKTTGKAEEQSSPVTSLDAGFSEISLNGESTDTITATLTQDGKHILVSDISDSNTKEKTPRVMIFDLDCLNPPEDGSLSTRLGYASIPKHICARIKTILGILPGSSLVFLDRDLWICTYPLGSIAHGENHTQMIQRLYFIPRDWVGEVSLDRCVLMNDGTVFWPRNDSVVVIECNLDDTRLSYSV